MNRKKASIALGTITLFAAAAFAVHAKRADASTNPSASLPKPTATALDQSNTDPPFGSFLGACNRDSDCSDGNVCASYKKRGNHCTHPCTSDGECGGGAASRCTKLNRCGLNEPVKTEP